MKTKTVIVLCKHTLVILVKLKQHQRHCASAFTMPWCGSVRQPEAFKFSKLALTLIAIQAGIIMI